VRRAAALLLGLLASCVLLGAAAPPARAHAALLSTNPGDGEILQASPASVGLRFGEPVGTGLGGVRVLTAQGDRVDTGEVTRTDGGSVVHVALRPSLTDGTYLVVWRVISADSHPVSGAFTFAVGAPSVDPKTLLGRGNLTSLTSPSHGPGWALGATRFLGYSAMLVLLGAALFALRVGSVPLRRIALWGGLVELASAGVALLVQGPYAAGLSLSHLFDTDLLREVLHTRYGEATATRVGLALAVVVLHRARAQLLAVLALGWSVTWALAGHAGVGEWQPVTAVSDVLHQVAVAAWVGGLALLIVGVRRSWWDEAVVLPRWSRHATWAVGVLVATGTLASVREVGELGALFSTTYGQRLAIKVALVGLMLLFALLGRAYVKGLDAEPTEEERASLRRSIGIEAGLAVAVVAVTAALVSTTPAKVAFAPPYTGTSTAGPYTVAIDVYPARKGLNGLHVYTVAKGGRTVDVAEVSGVAVGPGGERITVHPTHRSLGHYEDLNLVLPRKGRWTIQLQVRANDVDSYPTEQQLEVR
jgi:copper transport protein